MHTASEKIVKIKDFGHDVLHDDPTKRGFLAHVTSPDSDEEVPISYKATLQSPHW
jgi:hypothetical protein